MELDEFQLPCERQPPFASNYSICKPIVQIVLKFCRFYPPSFLSPKKTKNPNPSPIGNRFGFFLFGGRGWIRTTEAESSRFTVCPHWPLGNTPIFFCIRRADCLYILPRAKQFVNHLQHILSQFLHQSLQQTRPMEKPPGNQCSRAVFLGAGDRS